MRHPVLLALLAAVCAAVCAATAALTATVAAAQTRIWVDEDGVTHLSDDAGADDQDAGDATSDPTVDELRGLWDTPGGDGEAVGGEAASPERARLDRIVAGAVRDLERGENSRAIAALTSVLRVEPANPEAHWHLARLDRERGRWLAAEVHLEAFLASAGEGYERWRREARERLAQIADERRLADPDHAAASRGGGEAWRKARSEHFRLHYGPELSGASPDYAATVLRFLDAARSAAGERLGAVPAEPMSVMLYGKAAYLRAHRHRFSFQTVGFFDGRIHVVSAAHPEGELRALLFHEYTHAIFREQTGGDRPFWLNEGLAELVERASWGREGLTRGERSALKARIDADDWIPLRRLDPGFTGLDNTDARAAYLESTAAARWLEGRTSSQERGRILAILGAGRGTDEALRAVLGLDTEEVDAEVRRWVRSEFPDAAPASNVAPADVAR